MGCFPANTIVPPDKAVVAPIQQIAAKHKDREIRSQRDRLEVIFMNEFSINSLLEDLKNPDETVRYEATAELWRVWFHQKGVVGFEGACHFRKSLAKARK